MIDEIDFNRGIKKLRRDSIDKYCFYGVNCENDKIRKAHSIQKGKILNRISLDGHVLSVKHKIIGDKLNFVFEKMGKGEASTFPGFCSHHDMNIFKPIEIKDYQSGNLEQEFLFAYRALAVGYFYKMTHKNFIGLIRRSLNNNDYELIQKYIPQFNNYSSTYKATINNAYNLISNAFYSLQNLRCSFNTNLKNRKFHHIKTKLIAYDKEYHLAATSYIYLRHDVYGHELYKSLNNYKPPLFLTVFPQNGKTYVIMSYLKKDSGYFQFLDRQLINETENIQQKILSNIISKYISNFFLSPLKWYSLDVNRRESIIKKLNYNLKSSNQSFIDYDINLFI